MNTDQLKKEALELRQAKHQVIKTALNANGRQQGESPRNENKMMTAEKCAAIIVKGIRKRKREIIMTFVEGKLAVFLSKWLPGLVDRLSYSLMAKEPDSPFK